MNLFFVLIVLVFVPLIVVLLMHFSFLQKHDTNPSNESLIARNRMIVKNKVDLKSDQNDIPLQDISKSTRNPKPIKDWNRIIKQLFDLGVSDPIQLHNKLLTDDIFDTFSFPNSSLNNPPKCPDYTDRIDYPDITNKASVKAFITATNRETDKTIEPSSSYSFLFYQHLRKAGGYVNMSYSSSITIYSDILILYIQGLDSVTWQNQISERNTSHLITACRTTRGRWPHHLSKTSNI